MSALRPECALRMLDALDGMAYAARLACMGYWGDHLRLACLVAGITCGALIVRLPL